jgi:hypothetical protein
LGLEGGTKHVQPASASFVGVTPSEAAAGAVMLAATAAVAAMTRAAATSRAIPRDVGFRWVMGFLLLFRFFETFATELS